MNDSMHQYLVRIEQLYGQQTAFRFFQQGEIQSVSYEQFVKDVYCSAAGFRDYQGGHIAILARNSYAYIVNLFGIMAADAVAVTLNVEESWTVLKKQMALSDLDLILHDGEYVGDEPELGQIYADRMLILGQQTIEKKPIQSIHHDDSENFALMLFTSGTSTVSKGVMLSNHNLMAIAEAYTAIFQYAAQQKQKEEIQFYLCLPVYHAFELSMLLGCLNKGYPITLNRSHSYFQREIETMGCNCAAMVPSMLRVLAKHLKRNHKEKLGCLNVIVTAGAACGEDLIEMFERNGIRIVNLYGMSENCVISANTILFPQKKNSVGCPFGSAQIVIQNGEILVRSGSLMLGYYKNPEATAEALQDGWLHTGDLGCLDEDGYLYITGRKKNLIILSTGENVNPEELEMLLLRSPDVQETLVVEKNNRICALVYCAPEKQETVCRYVDEINTQVAIYKRISLVEFREEPFPRTASGKIKRV